LTKWHVCWMAMGICNCFANGLARSIFTRQMIQAYDVAKPSGLAAVCSASRGADHSRELFLNLLRGLGALRTVHTLLFIGSGTLLKPYADPSPAWVKREAADAMLAHTRHDCGLRLAIAPRAIIMRI
jgi:hypothetical protein